MYDELFNVWKYEIEKEELATLNLDFFAKLSSYIRTLREKNDEQSEKSVISSILKHELDHTTCMIEELLSVRYNKLIKIVQAGNELPLSRLSNEEKKVFSFFKSFFKEYQLLRKNIFQGSDLKMDFTKSEKRVIIRFLEDVPSLIGSDMNLYGPFLAEDLASLPIKNAELLVKQGLARLVEIN